MTTMRTTAPHLPTASRREPSHRVTDRPAPMISHSGPRGLAQGVHAWGVRRSAASEPERSCASRLLEQMRQQDGCSDRRGAGPTTDRSRPTSTLKPTRLMHRQAAEASPAWRPAPVSRPLRKSRQPESGRPEREGERQPALPARISPKRKPSRACRVGDQEDARGGRDSGEQFPPGSWAFV